MPAPAAATRTPQPGGGGTTTLVSFDVDGTLVRSLSTPHAPANALHKEAFAAAFRACFGLETAIDRVRHDGGTDPLILVKVLVEAHGVGAEAAAAALPAMQRAMVEHFAAAEEDDDERGGGAGGARPRARPGDGLELLPGARETLAALSALEGVATCLVTGNLEPIAWGKMRALGVDSLFTAPAPSGGYGSDHCSGDTAEGGMWRDRAELVRIARRRAEAGSGGTGPLSGHWHVGDTPADVRAALAAGAGAVAVATGAFSAAELRAAADGALAELAALGAGDGAPPPPPPRVVVLEHGLRDVAGVLAAMGLEMPPPPPTTTT